MHQPILSHLDVCVMKLPHEEKDCPFLNRVIIELNWKIFWEEVRSWVGLGAVIAWAILVTWWLWEYQLL